MFPSRRLLVLTAQHFSTSAPLLSQASKARVARPALTNRLRGTGVRASKVVYGAEEAVVGRPKGKEAPAEVTPPLESLTEQVEDELKATPVGGLTDADEYGSRLSPPHPSSEGPSEVAGSASLPPDQARILTIAERKAALDALRDAHASFQPEETIYTSKPPFPPALWLTATFVMAVFCLTGADLARVGLTSYDEETGEYELAPLSKRALFSGGFAAAGVAIIVYGSLVPARIITKLTIRRPPGTTSQFPPTALVSIYTPITSLPFLSARTVPLHTVQLLGPLATAPKPWHPRVFPSRKTKTTGLLATIRNTILAPLPPRPAKSPWAGTPRSHAPLIVKGDRATYTLARMGKDSWAQDWDGLEKALLGRET